MALTDFERAVLDFERSWWTQPGPKGANVREQFDLSAADYGKLLAELADRPDAEAHDPLVVRRLRRERMRRRRARVDTNHDQGRTAT
ncbi:MAG TPA: DUF3263 domain-containing protein [Acidimicrobiales bacterium]